MTSHIYIQERVIRSFVHLLDVYIAYTEENLNKKIPPLIQALDLQFYELTVAFEPAIQSPYFPLDWNEVWEIEQEFCNLLDAALEKGVLPFPVYGRIRKSLGMFEIELRKALLSKISTAGEA